jgi:trk system potassium uptake protein TrkH
MRDINLKSILRIVGIIQIIVAAFFLSCIPVALAYSESIQPFLLSFSVAIASGLLIYVLSRDARERKVTTREGYLSVTLGWMALIITGTLPYVFNGEIKGFMNILFETTSGFTTTGASILSDVEALDKSILFWRSLTHWIGGIGIILLVIIILPSLKIGGYNLFSLESSLKEKILPKTKSIAYRVAMIYLGLTVAEIVLLMLGGMDPFDSICHSFGSVATGGFSTKNTSLAGYSPYIQYVAGIFMFLAATSYVVFYYFVKGNFSRIKYNEEFWFYIFFVTASVVFVTLILYFGTERPFELSFRHAFFQVISQISCTGFATTDYMTFPFIGWFIMFLLMFSGGSTGSTTGGIKMARHLISLKNLKNTFVKLQHPNAILQIRLNGRMVPDNIVNQMTVFISLYLMIFLFGTLLMQLSGISVLESAGASATSMAGIGPGLGVSGNMGNFSHFNFSAKLVMVLLMIIGRLELFTFIAIFTKSFWRN